jgi:hypothetical protein
MSVTPSPIGGFAAQFFDNNGVILSGGKIFTYAAGTTTPQVSYTSALGITPHSNPIILDSAGRVPGGEIWLTDGLVYKFVIETATSILIGTYDNITGVNSNFINYTVQEEVITATAGQTVFNLSTINYTPGTNSLTVYIDGVNQYVGDSYLETDSDTVTFTSGVHVGGEVKFTTAVQTTTGAVDANNVGYTANFTGAVGQTVQTKLEQYVSVKDFGAVGDGVADDTVAIQAAIDATPYGTLCFPEGTYRITAPINIVTDPQAGITRRDRHLYGYGAVIDCDGVGQTAGFIFSCVGVFPSDSFFLFVEGFTFEGTVTRNFIDFPNAENFFENMLFERITTSNFAVSNALFFFENGAASNLGGVTIRNCSGGPNIGHFVELKGSTTYGQFDNFDITDCAHLGTGRFLKLNGTTATTALNNSRIVRNFCVGRDAIGIGGSNQFIKESVISNFYCEPQATVFSSIEAELISCEINTVNSQVSNFTGRDIRIVNSGGVRDTQIINCSCTTGTTLPYATTPYYVVRIALPENVTIEGELERYFNNAVQYTKPYVFPQNAVSTRIQNYKNDQNILAAAVPTTKTLYTFTKAAFGVDFDTENEVYEVIVTGQITGGVTNFNLAFQLHTAANTVSWAQIATTTLNSNARTFKATMLMAVRATTLQVLHGSAEFDGTLTTYQTGEYIVQGTVLRASNPVLRINCTTLDAQAMQINYVGIERRIPVSEFSWT